MLASEWIEQAKSNSDKIVNLLNSYHPRSNVDRSKLPSFPITAPNAERMCSAIREDILLDNSTITPSEEWTNALENNDTDILLSLLQDAWFGVPESTLCWSIEGFREAVELLENPPYEE